MDIQKQPEEIAREIILRNAKDIDVQDVVMLRDDIAQAIQTERDVVAARVQVANFQPGDTIMLSCPDKLSDYAYDRLSQIAQAVFGEEVRVIVMDGGMSIDCILRADEAGHD